MSSSRPSADLAFEIRKSSIQGRGAFATRRIRPGTRLIEYVGERISREEADVRYDDPSMPRHHTFLFALDDDTVIDAAVHGNEARYINHSCDPNCQAVIEGGHIFIEALRNIQPGAELTYDYAYERTAEHGPEDEALYACRCGSPRCRGSILAPKKKKKAAKRRRR
jgi:SET domain-containing protein